MFKVIIAEPLLKCVILIITELAFNYRIEEKDQFSKVKIKTFLKLLAIVFIVRAQVKRKIKENKTREIKCIIVFSD